MAGPEKTGHLHSAIKGFDGSTSQNDAEHNANGPLQRIMAESAGRNREMRVMSVFI